MERKEELGITALLPLTPPSSTSCWPWRTVSVTATGSCWKSIGSLRVNCGSGRVRYRSIQRMLVDGLIVERRPSIRRSTTNAGVYYRLTKLGLEVARTKPIAWTRWSGRPAARPVEEIDSGNAGIRS